MQPVLAEILKKRMDKACAIMLGVKERECDRHLPLEARAKLRKVILDQMNEFYDLTTDLMKSLDNDEHVVLNELYLQKLDAIHRVVTNGDRNS